MKNPAVKLLIIVLIVLDWAAIHDIIKGETNLTLEYSLIVLSIIVILAIIAIYVRKIKKSNPDTGIPGRP